MVPITLLLSNGRTFQRTIKRLRYGRPLLKGDEAWLRSYFEKHGWLLFGPARIREELGALQDIGYENTVAAVVTKLLMRNSAKDSTKA